LIKTILGSAGTSALNVLGSDVPSAQNIQIQHPEIVNPKVCKCLGLVFHIENQKV
jgi:hypothetical protein